MLWLLEQTVKNALEAAYQRNLTLDASAHANYAASMSANGSRVLSVAGSTARIAVQGVLTKEPDFLAMIFGGGNTTYKEIAAALSEAANNPEVAQVELAIDSPGGQIDGLFELISYLQAYSKPLSARVSSGAMSAAYAIAAQAGTITATNVGARFGSVGVVATIQVSDNYEEVTSSDAPRKRPDVRSDEGRAMIVEELDALHEIFVDAIAAGRGTTAKKVNADFGEGGVLLAKAALDRGMIDSIETATQSTTATTGGENQEASIMDLQTLQAQHPDVYAAAVKLGAEGERSRVSALLIKGEAADAMDVALEAVKNGKESTDAEVDAKFFAAGLNKRDRANRHSDDHAVGSAADNTASEEPAASVEDQTVALIAEQFGIEQGA